MTVIGIGQRQSFDKILILGDEAIQGVGVHQLSRPLKLIALQIGAIAQNAANPFIMDMVRLSRAKKIGHCQVHQQIAQGGGVQHTGIVKGREAGHSFGPLSIAHFEFLCLRGQFIQRFESLLIRFLPVGHQVAK